MKNLFCTIPHSRRKYLAGAAAVVVLASSLLTACAKSKPPVEEPPSAAESVTSQPEPSTSAPDPTQQGTEVREITVKEPSYTVGAGVSTANPDLNLESIDSLDIRSTSEGKQSVLLWIPLPSGIDSAALQSATLRLRRESGDEPQLQARGVAKAWDRLAVTWNSIQEHVVDPPSPASKAVEADWHELDVTAIVKTWFTGETGSNGFLLEQTGDNAQTTFFSPYRDDPADCPQLVITYQPTAQKVGPFGYEQQEDGNCLSFALRDQKGIFAEDLGIDDAVLEQEFRTGGMDQALAYVQKLSEEYVAAHAEGLQLAAFRQIPSFDAQIDSDREYRAVLKIGIQDNPFGISFDYHWRMQLDDGSWAEKFGAGISRIVPGSNGELDPGLYPWDQNEMWGTSKWGEFYTSKAIYYAVEKSTDQFTNHS